MLRKINITLVIFVVIGGLFLGGVALYNKLSPVKPAVTQSEVIANE